MPLRSSAVLLTTTRSPWRRPASTGNELPCIGPSCTGICTTIGVVPDMAPSAFFCAAVSWSDCCSLGSITPSGCTWNTNGCDAFISTAEAGIASWAEMPVMMRFRTISPLRSRPVRLGNSAFTNTVFGEEVSPVSLLK